LNGDNRLAMNARPDPERRRRWELVLGEQAQEDDRSQGAVGPGPGDGSPGDPSGAGERGLSRALEALYGDSERGDLGESMPDVARWLGDIRAYFPESVAEVMEQDAIRRLSARQLVQHPELLAAVEPDAALAATLLSLRKVMPAQTQDTARQVVARLVSDLMARLQTPLRQAVEGRVDRSSRGRRPRRIQDINWSRTVQANLRHYQPEQGSIVPERLVSYGTRRATLPEVILCIDTSGSMATSVVYAGISAAVLASIPSVKTRLVMFDTSVVDLTGRLEDPVELLFGLRLGGGTNIDRALAYCQGAVTRPRDTILILITDLFEGGDKEQLVRRAATLVGDGVRLVTLLALSDAGVPRYNKAIAQQLGSVGVPSFGCTPDRFPELMADLLNGRDLGRHLASG
jgi:Mg-chelatase subunit ChlD